MTSRCLRGLMAGAAGTTALNAATYLDMAVRGRPASTTPEKTVHRTEEMTGMPLSQHGSDDSTAGNRRSGLGALLGLGTGLGAGVVYAQARAAFPHQPVLVMSLVAAAAANVGSVAPMSAMGVSDPRQWPASSWVMDIVPHLAYGLTTAAVFEALTDRTGRASRRKKICC